MAKRNGVLVLADEAKVGQQFTCPGCNQPVILKRGGIKVAHFAHKNANCNKLSENESQLHLSGKLALMQMAQELYPDTQVETIFADIEQRADVYLPSAKIALEYQCSPIDQVSLQQRTQGYLQIGLQVIWILGNTYLKRKLTTQTLAKFARFDVNWGFYLLFWDAKVRHFVLWTDIVEVAGHYRYQQSSHQTYQELKQYHQQCQLHQPQIAINQHIKQLESINSQIKLQKETLIFMVTQCYRDGKILPACPIICHPKEAQFPIFGGHTLFWRILVVLKIFSGKTDWLTKKKLNLIFKETVEIYGIMFHQIPNCQRFYRLAFLQYLQELATNGYLKQTYDKVIITKRPKWFLDWDQKKRFWLQERKKESA